MFLSNPVSRHSPTKFFTTAGALAVTALGGYGLRGVLPGGGTVALPRRSRHPGLAVGPAPGGGGLERHPPCRTEQFVGPRQTHSA